MFKTLPNGVEIYFTWPSRTARVVPNESVRRGIMMRDNGLFALVAFLGLIASILTEPSPTIGVTMGLLCLGGFLERSRYLSKLPKMSLEFPSAGAAKTGAVQRSGSKQSVQVTTAEIDNAYIRERSIFDGVLVTVTGTAMAAGMLYVFFTQDKDNGLPLVFLVPLLACGLIFAYVGLRILAGKWRRRGGHRRKRNGAI